MTKDELLITIKGISDRLDMMRDMLNGTRDYLAQLHEDVIEEGVLDVQQPPAIEKIKPVAGEFYWVKMPRWPEPVIAEFTGSENIWRVSGNSYLESGAFICAHIPKPDSLTRWGSGS